jgi:AcrR family transcriptional regulator
LRSDAARNRERLLAAAVKMFSAGGSGASLESIAQAAGVGIGTLYRHFPTREALVEAVYRSELDDLADYARQLLRSHRAFDALRAWTDRYAQFVATKRAMLDALRIAWASKSSHVPETRARILAIITGFIDAGAADGTIRGDIDPDDVTVGLAGLLMATANATDKHQFRRLLGLLTEGLRPHNR